MKDEEVEAWRRLCARMTGVRPLVEPRSYEHVVEVDGRERFLFTTARGHGLGYFFGGSMRACFSWERIREEMEKS